MVFAALDKKGGVDYILGLPDKEFNLLLQKLLPKEMKIDASMGFDSEAVRTLIDFVKLLRAGRATPNDSSSGPNAATT